MGETSSPALFQVRLHLGTALMVGLVRRKHARAHLPLPLPPRVQPSFCHRHKVYKAFHWTPEYGGQAYNYTLKSLRNKLHNLWGLHYRSQSRSRSRSRE